MTIGIPAGQAYFSVFRRAVARLANGHDHAGLYAQVSGHGATLVTKLVTAGLGSPAREGGEQIAAVIADGLWAEHMHSTSTEPPSPALIGCRS